jgi:hypothetical protein
LWPEWAVEVQVLARAAWGCGARVALPAAPLTILDYGMLRIPRLSARQCCPALGILASLARIASAHRGLRRGQVLTTSRFGLLFAAALRLLYQRRVSAPRKAPRRCMNIGAPGTPFLRSASLPPLPESPRCTEESPRWVRAQRRFPGEGSSEEPRLWRRALRGWGQAAGSGVRCSRKVAVRRLR